MENSKVEKISITLPIELDEAIERFAEEMGVTKDEAVRHFLSVGMTMKAIELNGGEVVAHYPDGHKIQITKETNSEESH